jgi:hypothetical protein
MRRIRKATSVDGESLNAGAGQVVIIRSENDGYTDAVYSIVANGRMVELTHEQFEAVIQALEKAYKAADKARAELAEKRARGPEEGQSEADYAEEVADVSEKVEDARESQADAVERLSDAEESQRDAVRALEDAYLKLTKATTDDITASKEGEKAWRKNALAAGLTKLEIDKLVLSYRDLAAAKREAYDVIGPSIEAEAGRKREILKDWDASVKAGLISKSQLDAINKIKEPGAQLDAMASRLNQIQTYFGAPIKQYAEGGVVPGSGPQLAVVHGGETITPAGSSNLIMAREMAREFAKVLRHEMRAF